ncbi:MAG: HAMP domain-containing sensor histidine kinase [Verrucomicrobiota bacterium]
MNDDSAIRKPAPAADPAGRARLVLAGTLAAALVVLAAVLLWAALNLRRSITTEISNRTGEILDSVAAAQYLDDRENGETLTTLDDPTEQIELALKVSRLRDVIGVRLFAPDGRFVNAFPAYVAEGTLTPGDLPALQSLRPANHFLAHSRLEEQELLPETNGPPVPLLLVNIPLRADEQPRLVGIIQFIMNGSSLARQYAALDRQLAEQFTLAFVVAGGSLSVALVLAFGRLQRANRLLARRTADLLLANRELTLAAKTSAVGAVASYLIHGLKNPLSGLQNFVRDRAAGNGHHDADDWEEAAKTTQRMQDLISRIVGVLQQQGTAATYEIAFTELGELLANRMRPAIQAAGVRWETTVSAEGNVTGREADLILLILENLAQNAVEATPAGKVVNCSIRSRGSGIVAQIKDEGPGLTAAAKERLFSPCTSAKKNGSGIGLAISQQLAKHLGAELRLAISSAQGTCFELEFRSTARLPAPPAPAQFPMSPTT